MQVKALDKAMETIGLLTEKLSKQEATITNLRRDLDGKASNCASSSDISSLQSFLQQELVCTGKGKIYNDESKKCVCPAGESFDVSLGRCRGSSDVGKEKSKAGADCATVGAAILEAGFAPESGVYWINPSGSDAFKAYCDFDSYVSLCTLPPWKEDGRPRFRLEPADANFCYPARRTCPWFVYGTCQFLPDILTLRVDTGWWMDFD